MEERSLTLCVKRAASVALPSVFLMDTLLSCLYLVREKRCLVRTDFLPTGAEALGSKLSEWCHTV